MSELRKILVANRGEIASRIIRSAHDSNLSAVAIYTNSDKDSPYVKEADEAVRIGTSYLDLSLIHIRRCRRIERCRSRWSPYH